MKVKSMFTASFFLILAIQIIFLVEASVRFDSMLNCGSISAVDAAVPPGGASRHPHTCALHSHFPASFYAA